MLRLSACIEMLFREKDFYDRPAAAKAAELPAFEFWGWANKELERLQEATVKSGCPAVACCVDTRDESRQKQWRAYGMLDRRNVPVLCENLEETCEALEPLGIRTLILTVGNELPGVPREAQREAIVEGLRAAAPIAEARGVTIVLEPLNVLVDHKGYFLASSLEGFDILRAVNSPAVKLLFDIYHQQITEGNLIANITANLPLIGHFHVADNPGRHEPGSGEIHYQNVLTAIAKGGYAGYVGLEYSPSHGTPTGDSLERVMADAAKA